VSKVLGHTDVRTTQIYAHLAPSALHQTAVRAQAAFVGSSHDASTAQRPAARSMRNDGHARYDSNIRHPASKAAKIVDLNEIRARRGDSVEAILHVLREIAAGRMIVDSSVVRGLEVALDDALAKYESERTTSAE